MRDGTHVAAPVNFGAWPQNLTCLPMHYSSLCFLFSGVAFCIRLRFFSVMGAVGHARVVPEGVTKPLRFVASVRAADTWRGYDFARWKARGSPGEVRRHSDKMAWFAHAFNCSVSHLFSVFRGRVLHLFCAFLP